MPVLASVDGAKRHFRWKKAPWRLRFPKKEQNRNRCAGQEQGLRCAFERVSRPGAEALICILCAGSAGNYLQSGEGIIGGRGRGFAGWLVG